MRGAATKVLLSVAMISAFGSLGDARAQGPATDSAPVSAQRARGSDLQGRKLDAPGAADFETWQRVTLGTFKSVSAMRDALDAAGIHVGEEASEILGRPAFTFTKTKTEFELVVVSVADLGFGKQGASLADIYARAAHLGLALCPSDLAPHLRLQYLDQPVGDALQIAMKPLATYHGDLVDLTLGNGGEGLLLVGGDARADGIRSANARFVFVRARSAIASAARDRR